MVDEVDELLVKVRADATGFRREIAELRAELGGGLANDAERAGRAIEGALSRAIVTGKFGFEDLKRVAMSVLADIARAAIASGIGAVSGSGGGLAALGQSLLAGYIGAPGRATGGPVSPGRAYRVGERGPEMFIPTSSGRIEPSGGGARPIAITVHVRGDASGERQRLAQTGRQLARAVQRAIAQGDD